MPSVHVPTGLRCLYCSHWRVWSPLGACCAAARCCIERSCCPRGARLQVKATNTQSVTSCCCSNAGTCTVSASVQKDS